MNRIFLNIRGTRIFLLLGIVIVILLLMLKSRTETHLTLEDIKSLSLSDIVARDINHSVIKDSSSDKAVIQKEEQEKKEQEQVAKVISSAPVIFWIDLPNAFPWRQCLHLSNNKELTTWDCGQATKFLIVSQEYKKAADQEAGQVEVDRFMLKTTSGKCVVVEGAKVVLKGECVPEETGHWIWSDAGQLVWTRDQCKECHKCLTGKKNGQPLEMAFCRQMAEDQNWEVGRLDKGVLSPLDEDTWQRRQKAIRTAIMEQERPMVMRALEEVDLDTALHQFDKKSEADRRRAAVFYVDKGNSGITMLNWWIFTWRFIGLDKPDQGFDLVFMIHPSMVEKLPSDCVLVTEDFSISYNSSGQCLYKPYLGIAHRDKSYDGYMNSQECLYGPGSEFLADYDLLLRADLDTFPTPHMLDYWPQGVVVDIQYSTNHGLDNIKQALRDLACSVGIQHQEWFNMGSTWYGNGRRVRNLAKLTVALNKYGKAQMFGPGTHCRCANCTKLPKDCEWGGGPYAGTLLLYLQEIALNKILTQSEWDNMPKGQLDQGVTDFKRNVCEPVVLHCFHNGELFSKNAFMAGQYKELDMSELDMTNERDYAAYMALVSSNQGLHSDKMKERLEKSLNGQTWQQYCSSRIKS